MLTLAVGDIYVPTRATSIPAEFHKLLSPNHGMIPGNSKIGQVLCLGNVSGSAETLAFLHGISRSFHIARGESDDVAILKQELKQLDGQDYSLATYGVVDTGGLRIGFTNGYLIVPRSDPMALLMLARELDVDILVWGGTHQVEAYTLDGKFFVNPGSASGAYVFDWPANYDDTEGEEKDLVRDDGDSELAIAKSATFESPETCNDEGMEGKVETSEAHANDKDREIIGDESAIENANEATDSPNSPDAEHEIPSTEESPDASSIGNSENDENEAASAEEKLLSLSLTENEKIVKTDLFGQEPDDSHEKISAIDGDDDELDNDIIEKAALLTTKTPSFCLLDTNGTTCTLFIYTHVQGQVKVDKVVYKKDV